MIQRKEGISVDVRKKVTQIYSRYRRQNILQSIVQTMAAVVVFCTTYALILPAITIETDTICGLTEHTHSESCFQTVSPTECTLPESEGHTHEEACSAETSTLTCTLEETQAHSHTDACYTRTLVCETEEQAAHTHSDACLGAVSTLLCNDTAAEHAHIATCYSYETGLACGLEETEGHSHADSCFQNILSCTLAETEGHSHISSCFTVTRSLVCGLEESEGHSHTSDSTEPVTSVICGFEEHTHSDACHPQTEPETAATEDATATEETSEETIGAANPEPTEETTQPTETTPAEVPVYTHTDEAGTLFQVSLAEDTTVPADAALTVTAIAEDSDQYAVMAEQLQQVLTGTVKRLTLLDISFYDAAGEYLSVSDTAQVSVCFDEALFTSGQIQVFHFVEDAPVELEAVSVSHTAAAAEDGTESIQTQLTFETEGFSVFAVVEVVGDYELVDLTDLDQLDGNSFYIISNSKNYGMLTSLNTYSAGLAKEAVTVPTDLGNSPLWTFSKQDDGTYVIHSGDSYLLMQYSGDTAGLAHLKITTQANATKFTVDICDNGSGIGQVVISYTESSVTYYLNQYQGDNGPGFYGWKDSPYNGGDAGSKNYLYRNTSATDTTIPVASLNGKSFAIINEATGTAMSAIADTEDASSASALDALPASTTQIDGVDYFTSQENVPLWTFTAVSGKSGVYYISTTVGTETKYLNLTTAATSGALTLSTTAQELTVTQTDDGKVFIGNGTTRLNSSGSDGEGDFWCYNDSGSNCKMTLCEKAPIDSSFTITYNGYTITVNLQDQGGNPLYATRTDITMAADETKVFADIAPAIDDYAYLHAIFNNVEVSSVETNVDGSIFRFYEPDYTEDSGDFYSRSENVTVTLVYKSTKFMLYYDLSRPSGEWVNSDPQIADTQQEITADGQKLLSVTGGNEVGKFVLNTLSSRDVEKQYYLDQNTAQGDALTADNFLSPGAEYVFLGWKAAVDGNTWLFPEDADAYADEDGNIYITDTDGVARTLPAGTTLTGQWKQFSNVVMFFVNHGDTMLEDEDNQTITYYDNSYYAGIVAIGHIYNPETIDTGNIQKSTHDSIVGEFVPNYDSSNSGTQIVLDAVRLTYGSSYTAVSNYNEIQLENSVGSYLRTNTDSSKQIMLDKAVLDQSLINSDNYSLYWYVQKSVSTDGYAYHIDGVLVARTQPMEIYKTFSGLDRSQAQTAINAMTFPLHLIHTSGTTDVKDAYTTLTANSSQTGVYSSDGWQSTSSNIYKWTLESVQGQRYTFEEENYSLSGYDCSSLVSVHYSDTDKTVIYKYNTDATYTDITVDGVENAITDLFAGNPLIGGNVESIVFANFYTPTGTGMFSVSKVADEAGKVRLSGAEFQLKQGDTVIATVTTNENGAAHFSNLPAGSYTLTETQAPTGYQSISTTWPVVVAKDDTTGQVTVTVNGESVYDSQNGGIQAVYLIQNQPESTTVTVNKYFTTIMDTEVKTLTGYCIEVKDANNTVQKTLAMSDATPITGAINGYTWTMDLTCGASYTFTEKNYSHSNYLDTVVSAAVNGTAAAVTKSDSNTTASFSMTKSEAADIVTITNDYTNTFDLRIKKVDATNNNAAIEGVKFNIYGDFQFHVQPPSGIDATISYKDSNGNAQTAYYIGTTADTDVNGITQFADMHLSTGSNSFLYVIDEANTPAGYVKLDEPIVKVVTVNGTDGNYTNGVYTLTVENYKPMAKVSVTADVEWDLPEGTDHPDSVTLTLYKKTANGTVTAVSTVTLDANAGGTTEGDITITDSSWRVTWSNLPYAEAETSVRNEYYVVQSLVPGYNTGYSTELHELNSVSAAIAVGTQLSRSVTITNSAGFELPETGGTGTRWFAPMGLLLMLACAWLLSRRENSHRKRQFS